MFLKIWNLSTEIYTSCGGFMLKSIMKHSFDSFDWAIIQSDTWLNRFTISYQNLACLTKDSHFSGLCLVSRTQVTVVLSSDSWSNYREFLARECDALLILWSCEWTLILNIDSHFWLKKKKMIKIWLVKQKR